MRTRTCFHDVQQYAAYLAITTLWANSAGDNLVILFLFFPRKKDLTFHENCLHCMKRQFLFSGKNKIFQNVIWGKLYLESNLENCMYLQETHHRFFLHLILWVSASSPWHRFLFMTSRSCDPLVWHWLVRHLLLILSLVMCDCQWPKTPLVLVYRGDKWGLKRVW